MTRSIDPAVRLVMAQRVLLYLKQGQRCPVTRLGSAYALSGPEGDFARSLLSTQTQYWLFRTHQRACAGDFIALDRSSAPSKAARCFAIELKTSADLRLWRRGTQLSRCERAAHWLERWHAINVEQVVPVVGARADLLALLRRRLQ